MKQAGASMLGVGETADYPVILANLGGAWRIGEQTDVLGENLVAVFIPNSPMGGSQALRNRSGGVAGRTRGGRASLIGLWTRSVRFRLDVRIGIPLTEPAPIGVPVVIRPRP